MSHFSFNSSHEISLDRIYATRICIFVSLNNRTPEFSLPLTKIRRPHVSFYRKTRCIFVLKCSRTSPKIHSEQRTNFVEFRLHYFCTVLYVSCWETFDGYEIRTRCLVIPIYRRPYLMQSLKRKTGERECFKAPLPNLVIWAIYGPSMEMV